MKQMSNEWRRALTDGIFYLPVSAKTVPQESIDALEARRVGRLRELGSWRPSKGWRIDPSLPIQAAVTLHHDRWARRNLPAGS